MHCFVPVVRHLVYSSCSHRDPGCQTFMNLHPCSSFNQRVTSDNQRPLSLCTTSCCPFALPTDPFLLSAVHRQAAAVGGAVTAIVSGSSRDPSAVLVVAGVAAGAGLARAGGPAETLGCLGCIPAGYAGWCLAGRLLRCAPSLFLPPRSVRTHPVLQTAAHDPKRHTHPTQPNTAPQHLRSPCYGQKLS